MHAIIMNSERPSRRLVIGEPHVEWRVVGMVREAQAVVIGSGAFGSSTAYHLAAMGQQGIILLDAHDIASQTSPRAAGITKQVRNHPDMTRLAKLSVEK